MSTIIDERTEAQKAAARGAAFLDEQRTDHWRQKIDKDRLDIASNCDCVLGQLYDIYACGYVTLHLRNDMAKRMGFEGESLLEEIELTEAWKELL